MCEEPNIKLLNNVEDPMWHIFTLEDSKNTLNKVYF